MKLWLVRILRKIVDRLFGWWIRREESRSREAEEQAHMVRTGREMYGTAYVNGYGVGRTTRRRSGKTRRPR